MLEDLERALAKVGVNQKRVYRFLSDNPDLTIKAYVSFGGLNSDVRDEAKTLLATKLAEVINDHLDQEALVQQALAAIRQQEADSHQELLDAINKARTDAGLPILAAQPAEPVLVQTPNTKARGGRAAVGG